MMAAFTTGATGETLFTPLTFAVYHDQSHILELLLQAGGTKEQEFTILGEKYTAISYAEKKDKKKSLKVFQTFKPKVRLFLILSFCFDLH